MATIEETLRKLGLAAARGVPQLATGFVDLAALPFTMTGVMKPEQAVGSTAYLTSKGLLPPPQEGLLSETTELVSSAVNPAGLTKAALAKGGAVLAAPIIYHGSPHRFEKFDLSKMGTGEGQQMIAPGAYLSQSEDFAKGFMQDQRGQSAPTIAKKYLSNWGDSNLAIQKLDERYKTLLGESNPSYAQPFKDAADMLRKGDTDFSASLYKVDLPDSKARRMLNYEKELKNQPKHIRNLATKSGVDLSDTGFDLLQKLGRDQAGVEKLKNAGITGIKYSNEMTPGTSNYVVFDPAILNILERNNKPIKGLLK
jgi:hypothetical protein